MLKKLCTDRIDYVEHGWTLLILPEIFSFITVETTDAACPCIQLSRRKIIGLGR